MTVGRADFTWQKASHRPRNYHVLLRRFRICHELATYHPKSLKWLYVAHTRRLYAKVWPQHHFSHIQTTASNSLHYISIQLSPQDPSLEEKNNFHTLSLSSSLYYWFFSYIYPLQQAYKWQNGELDYDAKRYVMSVFYLIMIHMIYEVPNPLCKGL